MAERAFWSRALLRATRPSARALVGKVDVREVLGISAAMLTSSKKPPVFEYFRSRKLEHPCKIVLVRVGEFYEAVGIDAIMLVQHAGLNPMGRGIPRAGCPVVNLRRTLRDLVMDAGFSVVVCEEIPELYNYGSRNRAKERYIAQVVSPGNPNYLVGLIDEDDQDVSFEREMLFCSVSASVGGYRLVEADVNMMTYKVFDGQTIESVLSRLQSGNVAAPLYVHQSLRELPGNAAAGARRGSGDLRAITAVAATFQTETGGVEDFSGADPVCSFLDLLKRSLNLSSDWTNLKSLPEERGVTPQPIYLSTASQLGVHRTRGVPALTDYVVDGTAPALARQWIRKQLLLPPPPSVRGSLHRACGFLFDYKGLLPRFPTVAKQQVAQLVRQREANDVFFRELRDTCRAVSVAGSERSTRELIRCVLPSASIEVGTELELDQVLHDCDTAIKLIEETIAVGQDEPACDGPDSLDPSDPPDKLASMRRCNEDFYGKVRDDRIEAEWARVVSARERIAGAAEELLVMAGLQCTDTQWASKKDAPKMSYDVFNNAIWLKPAKGMKASGGLIHPRDRNGMAVPNRLSTSALEAAQDDYRRACFDAAVAVRAQLKDLSIQLAGASLPGLIGACVISTIASAMIHHVSHAGIGRRWNMPAALAADAKVTDIESFWPYWLDGDSPSTVLNTVHLDSMVVLTGPNMAGKSTILRSICATVLLATCGFLVPAKRAQVPVLDHLMLRTFSSDSPLEGRSGFAVEMHEMQSVLEDVSDRSLVLVDELGKGTEITAGAALAGSILERLDASGCQGIFATHLHALFELNLNTPGTKEMMMTTEVHEGSRRPTLRMAWGRSLETLAMTVARDCGLPDAVVERAEKLMADLRGQRTQQQAAVGSPPAPEVRAPREAWLAATNSPKDFAAAETLMRRVLVNCLQDDEAFQPVLIEDLGGQQPSPLVSATSCVYLIDCGGGWMYCGETDDIHGRLKAHQRGMRLRGLAALRCLFIPIPTALGGKSAARFCEAKAIEELKSEGFLLISDRDGRHRKFGRGGPRELTN